ncbi:hypothetical protein AB6A40_011863, partial [Gnathostoma spinigerum]
MVDRAKYVISRKPFEESQISAEISVPALAEDVSVILHDVARDFAKIVVSQSRLMRKPLKEEDIT